MILKNKKEYPSALAMPCESRNCNLHSLDLGNFAVDEGPDDSGTGHGDANGNSLALAGHQNNLVAVFDTGVCFQLAQLEKPKDRWMLTVFQQARQGKLSTMADRADGRVLENQALISDQESLQGLDDLTQSALIVLGLENMLSIHEIVEGDQALVLGHLTAADTAQLLHVGAHSENKACCRAGQQLRQ